NDIKATGKVPGTPPNTSQPTPSKAQNTTIHPTVQNTTTPSVAQNITPKDLQSIVKDPKVLDEVDATIKRLKDLGLPDKLVDDIKASMLEQIKKDALAGKPIKVYRIADEVERQKEDAIFNFVLDKFGFDKDLLKNLPPDKLKLFKFNVVADFLLKIIKDKKGLTNLYNAYVLNQVYHAITDLRRLGLPDSLIDDIKDTMVEQLKKEAESGKPINVSRASFKLSVARQKEDAIFDDVLNKFGFDKNLLKNLTPDQLDQFKTKVVTGYLNKLITDKNDLMGMYNAYVDINKALKAIGKGPSTVQNTTLPSAVQNITPKDLQSIVKDPKILDEIDNVIKDLKDRGLPDNLVNDIKASMFKKIENDVLSGKTLDIKSIEFDILRQKEDAIFDFVLNKFGFDKNLLKNLTPDQLDQFKTNVVDQFLLKRITDKKDLMDEYNNIKATVKGPSTTQNTTQPTVQNTTQPTPSVVQNTSLPSAVQNITPQDLQSIVKDPKILDEVDNEIKKLKDSGLPDNLVNDIKASMLEQIKKDAQSGKPINVYRIESDLFMQKYYDEIFNFLLDKFGFDKDLLKNLTPDELKQFKEEVATDFVDGRITDKTGLMNIYNDIKTSGKGPSAVQNITPQDLQSIVKDPKVLNEIDNVIKDLKDKGLSDNLVNDIKDSMFKKIENDALSGKPIDIKSIEFDVLRQEKDAIFDDVLNKFGFDKDLLKDLTPEQLSKFKT
ncbi:MAG: hypothetical protein OWS74_00930, partial [Firmicutes bacterium]|nr:hypothetical protein [Bacillota bacterium]